MAKKEHIVGHTDDELKAMQARGESKTDWAAAASMTDAEVEAAIASDPDEAGLAVDWASASVDLPRPKAVLNAHRSRRAGLLSP